jgi:hypothetical protein
MAIINAICKMAGLERYNKTFRTLLIAILVLGSALSVAQGVKNALQRSQDFQWSPSRSLLEHDDPYSAYLISKGRSQFLAQTPAYPATGLVFLWPYAALNWDSAKLLWAVSNIFFTATILYRIFALFPDTTPGESKFLIATIFLMGTPWRNALGNGQQSILTLAFFLISASPSVNTPIRGLSAAISWIKYTISFPLSLFLAKSKDGWSVLTTAGAIHLALLLSLAAWTHTNAWDLFIGSAKVAASPINDMAQSGVIDTFAVAARLGFSSALIPTAASLLILVISYFATRRDSDTLSCLSILSLASMTVCYHGSYDYVVLIFPLAYALRERPTTIRASIYLVLIGIIWFSAKFVGEHMRSLLGTFLWLELGFLYATLGADWINAFGCRVLERPIMPIGYLLGIEPAPLVPIDQRIEEASRRDSSNASSHEDSR